MKPERAAQRACYTALATVMEYVRASDITMGAGLGGVVGGGAAMGAAVDGRGSLRAPGGVRNQRSQASYWRSLLHCAPRHPLAPLSFHVYIAFQGGRPFFALKQA